MSPNDHQLKRHEIVSQLKRPPEYFRISRVRHFIRILLGGYHSETEVVERIILEEFGLNGVRKANNCRILDLGCGSGKTLISLKRHFDFSVGTDFSPTFCALANQSLVQDMDESSCLVVQNDFLNSLPFLDSIFNVLTMTQVLEHIEDVHFFLKETHRVLRKGGLIVLNVLNLAVLNRRLAFLIGHLPSTFVPRGMA